VHVSAVRPLRYRLRAQIYEFLLIRPPASAVFFVPRSRFHPFAATPTKTCELSAETRLLSSRTPLLFVVPRPPFATACGTQGENRPCAPSLSRAHHTHSAIFRFLPSHLHPPQKPTHAQRIRGEGFTPVIPSPCASPAAPLAPSHDRGQKWPKAVKTGAQGEAFTRNSLYFKRLCVNRREHTRGEAFTRNTLTLNTLQAKGEEVKAKNRKTPDGRASRVRVERLPCAARRPSWAGGEKTPLGAPPSREKIVTSQGAPLPSSRTWGHRPKTSQSEPSFFPFSP